MKNLGVFAEPKANLDRCLQAHPEIRDLVVRLLGILKKYFTELIEGWEDFTHSELSLPFSNAKDESDSDESSSSDSKYSTGLTLKAIHESLSELSQISFEKLSLIALGSLYPNAPRSLLIQLGKSMVDRHARLLLRKSQHETLGHDVRSHIVEPETTKQITLSSTGSRSMILPPQTPTAQKLGTASPAGPGSTIASLSFHPSQFAAKHKAGSPGIPKHSTTMVLASKNAPPVPNFEKGEEPICHWCFKSINLSNKATLEELVEHACDNWPREPNVCPLCYLIPKGQEVTDDRSLNSSPEVSRAMADHVTEHLQNIMVLSLQLIEAHASHQDNDAESPEGKTNASSVILDDQERTLPHHSAADLEVSDLESSSWSSPHLIPESTGAIPETQRKGGVIGAGKSGLLEYPGLHEGY
ncbi:hypothetical protein B7494_g6412 [Chlorociboria aeruginascens]|nr:hypothetical protein B7494_g6412 [Chlorociboria aeruginascens]